MPEEIVKERRPFTKERRPFTLENVREVIAGTDPALWAHREGLRDLVAEAVWQEFGAQ